MKNDVIKTPVGMCILESINAILQQLIRCNCITFEIALRLRDAMIVELPLLELNLIGPNLQCVSIDNIRKMTLARFECIIPSYVDNSNLINEIHWINEISRSIDQYTNLMVEIGFINKADSAVLNRKLNDDIMLIRHGSFKHSAENSIGSHKLVFDAISKRALFITRISRRIYGYVDDDTITGDRVYVKQLKPTQRDSYMKYLHILGVTKADIMILFNVSRSTVKRAFK